MRWVFAGLFVAHGLIHVMGFAKAFGLAELTALTQPISRYVGTLWGVAAVAFLVTGALVASGQPAWWVAAGLGVAVSQSVVFVSWRDARYGTWLNVVILVAAVLATLQA